MKTIPETRLSKRKVPGLCEIRLLALPLATAMSESTRSPRQVNTAPRNRNWGITDPFSGATNWGKNAAKNRITFGLRRFVKKPRRRILDVEGPLGQGSAVSNPGPLRDLTPSKIRYAAPA